jgi:RNA polymerase sigma-70 factor (sigma-E family)
LDPTTIEDFVAARGDAMLRFALMLCGDRPGAEDLTQSVLARALPRWSRIATMERPEAYLKKMIVNEYLRWRRRLWHGELPTPDPDLASASAVAAARLDGAGDHASRDAAWALLARLPRQQRTVLVLRYYEDLPDAEIAAVLGCQESTVRSNATRALASLRSVLPTVERETLP